MFLNIFKHLLPNALAWRLTPDKQLRQFFDGLSGVGDSVKTFYDEIWSDIDPALTRQLDLWEFEFGLPDTGLTEQERRDRLDAAWKAVGGQDPRYIQDTLQGAGFDVYVHEWWVPGTEPAIGSPLPATARSPFSVLTDGTVIYLNECGEALAQCGEALAECGERVGNVGYPLVNKDDLTYTMPVNPATFPYYLYIGGAVFGDTVTIDGNRRDEFETLCLKICPCQQWLGILVTYS